MKEKTATTKLIYSLEEVCRITGLEPERIEQWEQAFYFLQSGRTSNGEIIFRKKDCDILVRLKELIDTHDYTLGGAKRTIEEEFGIKTAGPTHPDLLKKLLFRIKEQLKDISSQLKE